MAYHRSTTGSASESRAHFHNSAFGDTTYTKVFVGGLAWETTSETLHQFFEQFGEILEAVVISDKNSGRSKGYGFVTFSDPESSRRACVDPNPIIDDRRTNCNLASMGRPQATLADARVRPADLLYGDMPLPRNVLHGSSAYYQPLLYNNYQQGLPYMPYGYMAYGPEMMYQQNLYNNQRRQYVQVQGVPGTINPSVYSYLHPHPAGYDYTAFQGYDVAANHMLQYRGPTPSGVTAPPLPTIQPPYPPGPQMVARSQFTPPNRPPRFTRNSGSDQMAG